MANDHRDRDRNRFRVGEDDYDRERNWRGNEMNRGMFGYEGEGFDRAGGGPPDYEDFARRGYGRSAFGDERSARDSARGDSQRGMAESGYRAGWTVARDRGPMPGDQPRGFRNVESGSDYGQGTPRPSFRGRGPKNYQRSDERIHEDVCERLAMDHDVDASDIEITVSGGTVTLSGTVSERMAKRRAENLAESVIGVKDVTNNLTIHRA